MSEVRQELPCDLEEMPPGPRLAAVLASLDRKLLDDRDRVRLVQARNRLVAHLQAELFRDMYAVTWSEPPEEGLSLGEGDEPYPWATTELALALCWTKTSAGVRLDQARRLVEDLPAVMGSLADGVIDVPKALVILDGVARLELEVARPIVDRVLVKAPELTTGQLRVWLRRLVMAADPAAAAKQAKARVKGRRVYAHLNDDQLADLGGVDLAPHRVAASWERIQAIAKAAKAAGDPRSIDELRADALLDLVIGEGIAIGEPITNGSFDTDQDHDEDQGRDQGASPAGTAPNSDTDDDGQATPLLETPATTAARPTAAPTPATPTRTTSRMAAAPIGPAAVAVPASRTPPPPRRPRVMCGPSTRGRTRSCRNCSTGPTGMPGSSYPPTSSAPPGQPHSRPQPARPPSRPTPTRHIHHRPAG